ncbi:MAG TPA: HAMP domain-containing sensor histidine kinase [Gemmatimonadaceae bacterium]|nr:HAMP domain-containing sensor histidine kinase [Gemmatimonadaceae bacterium]
MSVRSAAPPITTDHSIAGVTARPSGELIEGDYTPPRISGELDELAASGIGPSLAAALERSTQRVREAWDLNEDGSTADELRSRMAFLCKAIRQAAIGLPPDLSELAAPTPGRKMVERLRKAFLDDVSTTGDIDDASQIVHLLCALERVQAEIDRDTAQRFANKLSGADGLEMVVEVAHDLRSPLASVLFLAETLRNGQSGSINPIQERQLGLVYSAAFGLSALASDVIELVRGGERLMDLHPIPFSIGETLLSVRDIVLPIAEEKGLTVRITRPDIDVRVGHPAALNRVLLNLTTNALKFTSEGSVEVSCRAVSRSRIEFSVKDTGRGIPAEVLPTLFDAFRRRVKPGQFTFSSAGLGLSICRKLVSRMGGELRVDTAPGQGTRFHFELELPLSSRT